MTVATLELEVPVAISSPPSTKYLSTPGSLRDDLFDLARGGIGALGGSAVGQPHGDEERALIFVGQEARRQLLEQSAGRAATRASTSTAQRRRAGSGTPPPVRYRLVVQSKARLNQSKGARQPRRGFACAAAAAAPPAPG